MCTIYNKVLSEWVAVQYYWTMDESLLHLGESVVVLLVFGSSYGLTQIQHRLVQYPMISDDYPSNKIYILRNIYQQEEGRGTKVLNYRCIICTLGTNIRTRNMIAATRRLPVKRTSLTLIYSPSAKVLTARITSTILVI